MKTLELNQGNNNMLQIALFEFIKRIRELGLSKGIFIKEKGSNIFVNIVQIGIGIDEFLFESCKSILNILTELTGINVLVSFIQESQLTGLQLESLDYNDSDNIIYESEIVREDKNNTGIQYVKKI